MSVFSSDDFAKAVSRKAFSLDSKIRDYMSDGEHVADLDKIMDNAKLSAFDRKCRMVHLIKRDMPELINVSESSIVSAVNRVHNTTAKLLAAAAGHDSYVKWLNGKQKPLALAAPKPAE